jgi:GT2 family glycosyltransferase
MRASFLFLSTDEAGLLGVALPAAAEEEPDEIVVVDNASSDDTARVAGESGARVVRLEERASYCAAMNAGIAACTGDAVALLQADTFVTPGYLAAGLAALAAPGVGSVAPRLVRTLGPEPRQRTEQLDTAGMVVDRRRKNGLVGHGTAAAAWSEPAEVFGADGAAALYRRETLAECAIDGEVFDPDLERWASDADVAWRARVLGWACAYEPAALVHHVRTYSPSTRETMSVAARRMQFRNRYLMIAKNDSARELARDLPRVARYEALAFGHVLLRERELLGAYAEAWRRLPAARRRRRDIQARRRARRVPFGLQARPRDASVSSAT